MKNILTIEYLIQDVSLRNFAEIVRRYRISTRFPQLPILKRIKIIKFQVWIPIHPQSLSNK